MNGFLPPAPLSGLLYLYKIGYIHSFTLAIQPQNQARKKAEWRVTIRRIDKKMVEHIYANQNLFSVFVTL